MTANELKRFMKKNDFTQKFLGLVIGKSTRQVRYYMYGVHEIPQSVALLLMAYDDGELEARWLANAIKKLNPKAAKALKQ